MRVLPTASIFIRAHLQLFCSGKWTFRTIILKTQVPVKFRVVKTFHVTFYSYLIVFSKKELQLFQRLRAQICRLHIYNTLLPQYRVSTGYNSFELDWLLIHWFCLFGIAVIFDGFPDLITLNTKTVPSEKCSVSQLYENSFFRKYKRTMNLGTLLQWST